MKKNIRGIAIRHFAILISLGEMSGKDELILDLLHYAVRQCLASMEAAGATPSEVFAVYFELARQSLDDAEREGQDISRVIEPALDYAGYIFRVECGKKH
ncbi:hypothetical protein EJD96_15990 [Herbaspirillum seropedicae]|uniref:hypothetical protein n=1 Tax=Herbaspirillum seropedicae TaxID=964 RepID=UPI00111DBD91|nr:hypothetical protein [Herbaspirillum seropedicae]QDD65550.1 hypothetical protein EJD96_15990 [Herbaspirillum seropedicae]